MSSKFALLSAAGAQAAPIKPAFLVVVPTNTNTGFLTSLREGCQAEDQQVARHGGSGPAIIDSYKKMFY